MVCYKAVYIHFSEWSDVALLSLYVGVNGFQIMSTAFHFTAMKVTEYTLINAGIECGRNL